MIAVPIGPRVQRFATPPRPPTSIAAAAQAPARPARPRLPRGRFPSGTLAPWEFERDGEVVQVDPAARSLVSFGGGHRPRRS